MAKRTAAQRRVFWADGRERGPDPFRVRFALPDGTVREAPSVLDMFDLLTRAEHMMWMEQAAINLLADNECVHGRLPHDSHKDRDCRCWGKLNGAAS